MEKLFNLIGLTLDYTINSVNATGYDSVIPNTRNGG